MVFLIEYTRIKTSFEMVLLVHSDQSKRDEIDRQGSEMVTTKTVVLKWSSDIPSFYAKRLLMVV